MDCVLQGYYGDNAQMISSNVNNVQEKRKEICCLFLLSVIQLF